MIQFAYNLLLEILIHVVQTKTFRIQDVQHSLSMVFAENEAHDETLEFHQNNARHLQMTLEYALFKQLFHDIRLANAASTRKENWMGHAACLYFNLLKHLPSKSEAWWTSSERPSSTSQRRNFTSHTIDASLTFGSRVWLAESYLALVSTESVSKKKRNIFKRILWLEEQGVFISRYAPPLNNHRRPPFLGQHSPRRQC